MKKNYLPIALTILIGVVGILPLLIKPTTPFYSIDPDPAYVANGLEYIQIHKIFMADHPGTQLVIFLSLLFLPIKIFVNLVLNTQLAEWAIERFDLFMWLGRFSVFAVFMSGVYIFQMTFLKLFKSSLVNLFLTGVLFLVPYFYTFQGLVTPEVFGLFFTSVWFYFIGKYLKDESVDFITTASVFAGLAVASKMTFAFVIVATIAMSLYTFSSRKLLFSVLGSIGGFVLGTIPILLEQGAVKKFFSYLLVRESVFNPGQLIGIGWFGGDEIILVLIIVSALFLLGSERFRIFGGVFLSGLTGLLAFAKYPSLHYQFANFLLIALSLVILFARLKRREMLIVLILLLPLSTKEVMRDFYIKRNEIVSSARVQEYSDKLPSDGAYIWDIVGSKEYSLIRGKEWSNWFYSEELKKYRPNLWYLYPADNRIIINNEGQRHSIDSFCWDGLLLTDKNWDSFINQQITPDNYLKGTIHDSSTLFITHKECPSK